MANRKDQKTIRLREASLEDGNIGKEITLAASTEYTNSLSVQEVIALKEHFPDESAECAKLLVERLRVDTKNLEKDGSSRQGMVDSFSLTVKVTIIMKVILLIFSIIFTTTLFVFDNKYFIHAFIGTISIELVPFLARFLSGLTKAIDKKQE